MQKGRYVDMGELLRETRAALHFTQETLAARVGVSRRTVNRWEMGDGLPHLAERMKLLEALAGAPAEARAELASYLNVAALVPPEAPPAPPPAPAPSPAAVASAVECALLAVAEDLDVSPRRLPRALAAFLQRLADGAIEPASARAHLLARRASPSHHVEGEP